MSEGRVICGLDEAYNAFRVSEAPFEDGTVWVELRKEGQEYPYHWVRMELNDWVQSLPKASR